MSAVSGGNCSAAAAASFVNESMAFVAFSVGLAMVDAVIICGNTLVILAVLTSHSLRSVTSLLVSSLAVADLLVGVLVLPFSIANEVLGHVWVFGAVWCQIWLAVDVWMCTASIYNLVVISIERYVAILKPLHYPTPPSLPPLEANLPSAVHGFCPSRSPSRRWCSTGQRPSQRRFTASAHPSTIPLLISCTTVSLLLQPDFTSGE